MDEGKKITRYIELVYSEKSELNKIQDLEERKKTACHKAGLKYDDPKVKDIINLKNKDVNVEIFDHLRSHNSNKYILLICNQHLFWEQMQQLMEPLKPVQGGDTESYLKEQNLKNTISEKAEELLDRINNLRADIFKDAETSKMADNIIKFQRPEDRLKKKAS